MYRGLSTFISDIRNAKTKESEQQRIDKELANIRAAFSNPAKLSAYDRRKYSWKMLYINMIGYDIDFGMDQLLSLLSSPEYADKLVGYMTVSVLMRSTDSQMTLVVQAIKNDLQSTQDATQCLALAAIANLGGKELAEAVAVDVQRILFSRAIFPVVRKKAALCLLRLVRISRELMPPSEWAKKLITLLDDKHLGVVLSVVTLILGLAEKDPAAYEGATGPLLVWLTRLAVNRHVTDDYVYHGTPCPWLQVRILRLLQMFPIPPTEAMRTRLTEVLAHILNKTEVTKSVNRNNAEHCVLFEAIHLIIKQGEASEATLRAKAVAHLSKFINIREPNIRYLGLDTMSRLVNLEGTGDAIRRQQATIMFSLKDADISVRRRALDLLFAMCDRSIAESVVRELLSYLAIADWAIKDEMVLKLAILAERFAPDMRWYVDTILQLLNIAGDFVSDDIWHRVVQIVTNREDLQKYAASRMYKAMEPASAHETAVKVAAYVLGEFGYLLNESDADGGPAIGGTAQFAVLHQHFPRVGTATKCILLSAYAKMQNLYPEIRSSVLPIFEAHTTVIDAELQQRALEYLHLPSVPEAVLSTVLDAMPPFPERASMLEARLEKVKSGKDDKDVWGKEGSAGDKKRGDGEEGEGDEDGGRRGSKADAESVGGAAGGAGAAGGGDAFGGDAGGDLLGLASGGAGAGAGAGPVDAASVPVTRRIEVEASQAGQVAAWFNALVVKPGGVLYEDAHVQVGCKTAFTSPPGGSINVFVGNKGAVPLVAFKLRTAPSAAVKVEVGDAPSVIAPKAQVQVPLTLESLQPFTEAPRLMLSFISTPGTGHAYALSVPVALHNFCEPIPMGADDYKGRWTALAGAPREVTAAIAPAAGADAITMAAASAALAKINMSSVDAGAPGATGASSFRTASVNAAGARISVGCLAMVIPAPAAGVFKVAVRTQHEQVSKALMAVLQQQLEAATA